MSDDNFLFHKTANELRAHPETLAIRVSREHYLWLADGIRQLQHALDESVDLQSHYADLLNLMDGGKRLQFRNGEDWIARLSIIEDDGHLLAGIHPDDLVIPPFFQKPRAGAENATPPEHMQEAECRPNSGFDFRDGGQTAAPTLKSPVETP